MASKHMKRYSVSLVIKERQIKTTVQYHLAPVKTTITTTTKKTPKMTSIGGCGEIGTLVGGKCNMVKLAMEIV